VNHEVKQNNDLFVIVDSGYQIQDIKGVLFDKNGNLAICGKKEQKRPSLSDSALYYYLMKQCTLGTIPVTQIRITGAIRT